MIPQHRTTPFDGMETEPTQKVGNRYFLDLLYLHPRRQLMINFKPMPYCVWFFAEANRRGSLTRESRRINV
jgi:hypothetical protein